MTQSTLQQTSKEESAVSNNIIEPSRKPKQGYTPEQLTQLFVASEESTRKLKELLERQKHTEIVLVTVVVALVITIILWLISAFSEKTASYNELLKQIYTQKSEMDELRTSLKNLEI